jgi:hypothetical protein
MSWIAPKALITQQTAHDFMVTTLQPDVCRLPSAEELLAAKRRGF